MHPFGSDDNGEEVCSVNAPSSTSPAQRNGKGSIKGSEFAQKLDNILAVGVTGGTRGASGKVRRENEETRRKSNSNIVLSEELNSNFMNR